MKVSSPIPITMLGLLLLLLISPLTSCLDNGLALTPPMGWLSWERFRCNVDCKKQPKECISENLYKAMADRMVSDGYIYYGYKYVNIDDCWASKERTPDGKLAADPERFPSGIKALADYMHERHLKLGIYADIGTETCGGYPGSQGHLEQDADTFAEWGVDMLKMDGCYANNEQLEEGYPAMSRYLNKTGRPILFSCSWPAYQVGSGKIPDYQRIANYCNIWRNYDDVEDTWESVKNIINFYVNDTGNFSSAAGPGHFNDPDMLLVGDYGLSIEQQKVQLALWAIMAAPMFISDDLRSIAFPSKNILLNHFVRSVSQDPMGVQGKRISKINNMELWTKPMAPDGKSLAYVFRNLDEFGGPRRVSLKFQDLGLTAEEGYNVTDVFGNRIIGIKFPSDWLNITVNPTGSYFGAAVFGPLYVNVHPKL